MTKAGDHAVPIERLNDLVERAEVIGNLIWRRAPRDFFRSEREWRRWNERYCGKPVLFSGGALRAELVEAAGARRKWHVHIVLGSRRFSLRSHGDREHAYNDYLDAREVRWPDPVWVSLMATGNYSRDPISMDDYMQRSETETDLIAITDAAFDAIRQNLTDEERVAASMPVGSAYETEVAEIGKRIFWLERRIVDKLAAPREPGEGYSDAILRLARQAAASPDSRDPISTAEFMERTAARKADVRRL
jgi:hypothetical protein